MRPNNLKEFFPERYPVRLSACRDVLGVFELVRDAVKELVGVVRSGLELGLAELEEQGGMAPCALHPLNCNCIVINLGAVRLVQAEAPGQLRAFLFHSLLYEYLHTIGLAAEHEVGGRALEISLPLFGEEHPVTRMAEDLPRALPGVTHPRRMPLPAGTEVIPAERLELPPA